MSFLVWFFVKFEEQILPLSDSFLKISFFVITLVKLRWTINKEMEYPEHGKLIREEFLKKIFIGERKHGFSWFFKCFLFYHRVNLVGLGTVVARKA